MVGSGVKIYTNEMLAEAFMMAFEKENIEDITVIDANYAPEGKTIHDFYGLDFALELVKTGGYIVVFSIPFEEELRREQHDKFFALKGCPNVAVVYSLDFTSNFKNIIEDLKNNPRPSDPLSIALLDLNSKISVLSTLRHDLGNAKRAGRGLEDILEKAQKSGFTGSDEKIISIIESSEETQTYFSGQSFSGLFVDVEGTILDVDGNINQKLVDFLHRKEKDTLVTVWTGGDLEEIRRKLINHIPWKITSKSFFRGAEVETVIDNEPREIQENIYGFKAVNYIWFPENFEFNI